MRRREGRGRRGDVRRQGWHKEGGGGGRNCGGSVMVGSPSGRPVIRRAGG